MGIRFLCPNCGHKLNVKSFLAGKRGVCPQCGAGLDIPLESQIGKGAKAAVSATDAPTMGSPGGDTIRTVPVSAPTSPSKGDDFMSHDSAAPAEHSVPTHAAEHSAPIHAVEQLPMGDPSSFPSPVGQSPVATPYAGPPSVPMQPIVPAEPVTPAAPVASPVPAKPVDPIDEGLDLIWYVRPPSGGQYGPARGEIMRKWIGEGRVSADSLVWREGWEDWRGAAEVFPSLGGWATPPVPGPTPAGSYAVPGAMPGTTPMQSSGSYRPRRRNTTHLAIAAVVILGLMSIGLFGALVLILSR